MRQKSPLRPMISDTRCRPSQRESTRLPPLPHGGPPVFARLGPWCHDRRKRVLVFWIVALAFVNVIAGVVGNGFRDEFNLPDVESKRGFDVLDESFGGQGTGSVGTIVFSAEQGVDDPEVQA